ncbi:hypothetical protein EZS27_024316 [termite gut metagenome]|uniref:Uncharacterized protein n=1 Tax=termite gut metagenome TaxID=433724 RepID=A0A5J4QYE1_9ZZZZ
MKCLIFREVAASCAGSVVKLRWRHKKSSAEYFEVLSSQSIETEPQQQHINKIWGIIILFVPLQRVLCAIV